MLGISAIYIFLLMLMEMIVVLLTQFKSPSKESPIGTFLIVLGKYNIMLVAYSILNHHNEM